MGYPTSQKLAEAALTLARSTIAACDYNFIQAPFKQGDYPLVFERVITALGISPVLSTPS